MATWRFSRLCGWGGALLTTATLARPAGAEAPYGISYRAPDGCPSEQAFVADVSAQVKDPSSGDGAQLAVVITAEGGGYQGELVVTDRAGATDRLQLELERPEPSCVAVAHALAFKASIAIRYGGHFAPPPVAAAAPKAPPARSRLPPSPPPRRAASGPRGAVLALHTAGGILGGLGPRVRPLIELGASVGDGKARLLSPWISLSVEGAAGSFQSPVGDVGLWLVRGRAQASLLRLGGDAFFVRPLVGLAVGAVLANPPPDAQYLESPTNPWISVELGLQARWNVTRAFFVQAEAGPSLLLVGERYVLDGPPSTSLYSSPDVSARAALGLGIQL
jgi:hypothetical protein